MELPVTNTVLPAKSKSFMSTTYEAGPFSGNGHGW
jgi:hypothetical protein